MEKEEEEEEEEEEGRKERWKVDCWKSGSGKVIWVSLALST